MRKFLILALLAVMAPTAALACKCSEDTDGSQAAEIMADPAVSIVDVTVRGYNTNNGQSMLQIDNIRHGSIVARDIRASFGTSSCRHVPNKKKMTLVIRNQPDGTYAIDHDCAQLAIQKKLKGQ